MAPGPFGKGTRQRYLRNVTSTRRKHRCRTIAGKGNIRLGAMRVEQADISTWRQFMSAEVQFLAKFPCVVQMRNTHVIVEGRAMFANFIAFCILQPACAHHLNNDDHEGLQQTGVLKICTMASGWMIKVPVRPELLLGHADGPYEHEPEFTNSSCAAPIPCRSHVRYRQPCVWEDRHIKIKSTGIATKLTLPKRPHTKM